MGRWTALAEEVEEACHEPGFGAAASVAAAWSARLDPVATRSLVTAAVVLAGEAAVPALWERLEPCPDAPTLLKWGEELEANLADLLRRCKDTGEACRAEHDGAVQACVEAAAIARQAPEGPALDAARDRGRAAARVVADCEAALDQLGAIDGRLRYALAQVRALPADLEEAYEAAARLIAAGGALPFSGDFIAPGRTPETTTNGKAS